MHIRFYHKIIIKVHSVNCNICICHFCCGKCKIQLHIVSLKFSNTTKKYFCSHKNILRSDSITKYAREPKSTYIRDPTRNGCIKEFIKRKWSSGLIWATEWCKSRKSFHISLNSFILIGYPNRKYTVAPLFGDYIRKY